MRVSGVVGGHHIFHTGQRGLSMAVAGGGARSVSVACILCDQCHIRDVQGDGRVRVRVCRLLLLRTHGYVGPVANVAVFRLHGTTGVRNRTNTVVREFHRQSTICLLHICECENGLTVFLCHVLVCFFWPAYTNMGKYLCAHSVIPALFIGTFPVSVVFCTLFRGIRGSVVHLCVIVTRLLLCFNPCALF